MNVKQKNIIPFLFCLSRSTLCIKSSCSIGIFLHRHVTSFSWTNEKRSYQQSTKPLSCCYRYHVCYLLWYNIVYFTLVSVVTSCAYFIQIFCSNNQWLLLVMQYQIFIYFQNLGSNSLYEFYSSKLSSSWYLCLHIFLC